MTSCNIPGKFPPLCTADRGHRVDIFSPQLYKESEDYILAELSLDRPKLNLSVQDVVELRSIQGKLARPSYHYLGT